MTALTLLGGVGSPAWGGAGGVAGRRPADSGHLPRTPTPTPRLRPGAGPGLPGRRQGGRGHFRRGPLPRAAGLQFPPGADEVLAPDQIDPDVDVVLAVDCSSPDRLGRLLAVAEGAGVFAVLDHHASNTGFGGICVVQPGDVVHRRARGRPAGPAGPAAGRQCRGQPLRRGQQRYREPGFAARPPIPTGWPPGCTTAASTTRPSRAACSPDGRSRLRGWRLGCLLRLSTNPRRRRRGALIGSVSIEDRRRDGVSTTTSSRWCRISPPSATSMSPSS